MSTGTITAPVVRETLETGNPTLAHIVAPSDTNSGAVLAMEARFNGTPVTALCGHVFVPSRDPNNVPPCQKCSDIFEGKFPGEQPSDA